jgi:predicted small secreted protein
MKQIARIIASSLLAAFVLSACTTARNVTEDSAALAGHAVRKTGHAIAHGEEKLANHL